MGIFAGTERQCTEDEHDDEDENDSQISEFGLNGCGPKYRRRDRMQSSIGFQPVPRDHCALPCEIGNYAGMAQSRRSITARYRLEAYATLHPPSALKII